MNANAPESCLRQDLVKDPVSEIIPIQGTACFVTEYPVRHIPPPPSKCLLFSRDQEGFQRIGQLRRHIDAAHLPVLGSGGPTRHPVAPDLEKASPEIDISPLQSEQFA
jgi:hypothetical protein